MMVDPGRLRAAAPLMYEALKVRRAVSLHDPDCWICISLGGSCTELAKLKCLAFMLQEDALMKVAGFMACVGCNHIEKEHIDGIGCNVEAEPDVFCGCPSFTESKSPDRSDGARREISE